MRLLANVQKSLHFLYLRDFLSKSCPPKIRQIALMQLFQHKPTKLTFIMGRPAREKASLSTDFKIPHFPRFIGKY